MNGHRTFNLPCEALVGGQGLRQRFFAKIIVNDWIVSATRLYADSTNLLQLKHNLTLMTIFSVVEFHPCHQTAVHK